MMGKPFWIPLAVAVGTMVLLFSIGAIAKIDLLMFKLSLAYTEISFVPIGLGFLAGLIAERILKHKQKSFSTKQ